MKSTMVCLCRRLLSIISWFTDLCLYWTCWRGLEGFGSPSPLTILNPVILKENCTASYKIILTTAVKWQGKGEQSPHLNILFFRMCSKKLPALFFFFNFLNEPTPTIWIQQRFQKATIFLLPTILILRFNAFIWDKIIEIITNQLHFKPA